MKEAEILSVICPGCGAASGIRCMRVWIKHGLVSSYKRTDRYDHPHKERYALAKQKRTEKEGMD